MDRESQSYQLLLTDGNWHGPYTLDQIKMAWKSGQVSARTAYAVTGTSVSRSLSDFSDILGPSPIPTAAPAPSESSMPVPEAAVPRTPLVGIFTFLGACSIVAAVIGVLMLYSDKTLDQINGRLLIVNGLSGGLMLFALAKVLDFLNEMTFRIRNLEQMARKAQG